MNRAERRRQGKQQTKLGHSGSPAAQALVEEGKRAHQAGRFLQAEQLYRSALATAPDHPAATHYLGLLYYRLGRLDEALQLLTAACRLDRANPLYWFNAGVVAQRAGKRDDAARAYEQSLALNPRHLEARVNLGNVLKELGRLDEAERAYEQVLRTTPGHVETLNNLGVLYKERGREEQAIASYNRAIALKPDHAEAHNNLGLIYMDQGHLDQAIACYERALQAQPGYLTATYNLGMAAMWTGAFDRALTCFRRTAEAKHNHGRPVKETVVYRSRVKHDTEQLDYLLSRRLIGQEFEPYSAALKELQRSLDGPAGAGNRLALTSGTLQAIAPSFNRLVHIASCERLPDGAINPQLEVAAIEGRYHAAKPEVTFADDLLRPQALDALRRFCWESTIWKRDYENGYIGAFLGDGFATPLLLQIAEELRSALPKIFGSHPLTQAWAFKQDSARRGLNIHADAAAVNVNFWITADEANLNADSGGLVVWNKEAPRDWNFKDYNSDSNRGTIYDWLRQAGADQVKIPYRSNRAVVFNSDLFHESDDISFKEGYTNRRINITLLYGYRHRE
ncbi:MAG TPA: tetratricopeptide repeat protein [Nitrospiraceae bacterium]|nr:tetratricopeptide repeat protein [Nitrospiraceae bacterium]